MQNWQRLKSGDLDWSVFKARSDLYRAIRHFFHERGYLEVDPAMATPYPTLDANIEPLAAQYKSPESQGTLYLHTSPEHAMKKLLAGGAEKIYYLGKVFRNGEITSMHNPEFTMLEWYRTDADYNDIMQETESLIRFLFKTQNLPLSLPYSGQDVHLQNPWPVKTIQTLFMEYLNFSWDEDASLSALKNCARTNRVHFEEGDDWDTLYFRLFLEKIEPFLGFPQPVFVTDYPVHMGMMARCKDADPRFAERTELYMGALEIANGYSELLDHREQKKRFEAEKLKKTAAGYPEYKIDGEMIDALKCAIPPTAGMALGVDRLLMLMRGEKEIQNVLCFPMHQWMNHLSPNHVRNRCESDPQADIS